MGNAKHRFNPRDIPWKRVIVESFAIVASILLAFAIDAAWEKRGDRSDERIVLQSLLSDLRDKQEFAKREHIRRQATYHSAVQLLELAIDSPPRVDEALVSRLLGDILWTDCAECWISAPLNMVVSGSTASTLSSAGLIQALSELHVVLSRLQTERQITSDFYFNTLAPYLAEHADIAHLSSAIKHEPGHPDRVYSFPIKDIGNQANYTALLTDLEFRGLLAMRIDQHGEMFRPQFMQIDDLLEEVIDRLERELARL